MRNLQRLEFPRLPRQLVVPPVLEVIRYKLSSDNAPLYGTAVWRRWLRAAGQRLVCYIDTFAIISMRMKLSDGTECFELGMQFAAAQKNKLECQWL